MNSFGFYLRVHRFIFFEIVDVYLHFSLAMKPVAPAKVMTSPVMKIENTSESTPISMTVAPMIATQSIKALMYVENGIDNFFMS